MKLKYFAILGLFLWVSNSHAQKISLLVPDTVTAPSLVEERLKIIYSIREELANHDSFALVSRNATAQLLKGAVTPNGASFAPKAEDLLDPVADVLLKNDIDVALVTEIRPVENKYLFKAYLVNYMGILALEENILEPHDGSLDDALKTYTRYFASLLAPWDGSGQAAVETEEMIFVPAGSAIIGSFNGEAEEAPQRVVYVHGFYIDKYEITNSQYKKFVDATGRKMPVNVVNSDYTLWNNNTYPEGLGQHPIVNVTWYDAKAYCEWVGKRLPSAVEWEKAARGPYGNVYPWGNEFFEGIANLYVKGLSYEKQKTTPVGCYPKSKSFYGIHDLAGNVWEWTRDVAPTRPGQAAPANRRIAKGGGWGFNGNRHSARASYFLTFSPDYTSNCLGFRCAK